MRFTDVIHQNWLVWLRKLDTLGVFYFLLCQMTVTGYYSITLVVCVSVSLSVLHPFIFSLLDDNLSKCQWIFTKLGFCIDIVRSGLGLLMGKFHQFLTELSVHDTIMAGYYCSVFCLRVCLLLSRVMSFRFYCCLYVSAVIFVLDSSNKERLQEAYNELAKLVQEKELKEASLLIFANKQVLTSH